MTDLGGFFGDFLSFRPKTSPIFLRSRLRRSRYFLGPSGTGYAQKPSVREPARSGALASFEFPKGIGACKFKNYVFCIFQKDIICSTPRIG